MNPFEHEKQYMAYLCEATDELPFACLQYVLKNDLRAQQMNDWWARGRLTRNKLDQV